MIAFLTVWKSPTSGGETKRIECNELIIKDGPKVEFEGDECQLFHVVAAEGIYHNVAIVEVM